MYIIIITQVDLEHVEHFIGVIGAFEDQIFQKRARLLQRQKQRRERDKANSSRQHTPGQGQAGGKWKAAVPNASFTASLQPVGRHQSGKLLRDCTLVEDTFGSSNAIEHQL